MKKENEKRRIIIPIQRYDDDDQTANRQTNTITSLLTYPPFRTKAHLGKRGKVLKLQRVKWKVKRKKV